MNSEEYEMFSSQKLFMVAYVHLSALVSFLNSVLFNKGANLPQNMLRWLFSESSSETTATRKYIFKFLPPLFCICLTFAKESQIASEGMDFPLCY